MAELWDIYDINKKKIGKTAERDTYQFKEGEYHIVVTGIIINSKNEILISKRAKHKKFGLMWECSGGSILAGETSLEGIIRELKEELGIEFSKKEAIFLMFMSMYNRFNSNTRSLFSFPQTPSQREFDAGLPNVQTPTNSSLLNNPKAYDMDGFL